MKPHVSPTLPPTGGAGDLAGRKTILATDIARDPARRALWRSAGLGGEDAPAGDGFASAMGYWLASPAVPDLPAGSLGLTLAAPGEATDPVPASFARTPDGAYTRPVQTLRVKAPSVGDGDATLTIGPGGARVTATPAAWKALAEPVLLAVCQYWRFAAVEAEIARLTEAAHGDLDHSNMPGPSTLRAHGRVVRSARDARALMLDLPHFQGPLSDPYPYCSTERAAQVYESLAEKLRLEEWSELIDDRAEAVEDTYEALTEKLFEFKNFAWEAALECLIIVILLAELAVGLYETFGP